MTKTITKTFRETTYGDFYTFRYCHNGQYWEIFVDDHPANPIAGAYLTHILPGNRVCITSGREPKTFEQAVACSWTFIHYYSNYIRTGSTAQPKLRSISKDYNDDGTTRR
jgi:hypothetical protein